VRMDAQGPSQIERARGSKRALAVPQIAADGDDLRHAVRFRARNHRGAVLVERRVMHVRVRVNHPALSQVARRGGALTVRSAKRFPSR